MARASRAPEAMYAGQPSLSTSGETLTIEESVNLEGENGERRTCCRRARMELGQRLRLLPPAAKTSLALPSWGSWPAGTPHGGGA